MARKSLKMDLSHILAAVEQWIQSCLIEDRSVFSAEPRWTAILVAEVFRAFVQHPDFGDDDFMTKLKRQIKGASPAAQELMAELLWALLLFPSNMKARTKRQQVRDLVALTGQHLADNYPLLDDQVLAGIGSGGPGFNNYRPNELEYLTALVGDLKQKSEAERRRILTGYDEFSRLNA